MVKIAPEKIRFAALATDVVLFTINDEKLKVLLMRVNSLPYFKNKWGFPGGLLKPEETAIEAAQRVLETKGKVDPKEAHLEQLYTFSEVNRDPRNRVVSVAYLGLIPEDRRGESIEDENLWWVEVGNVPKTLAYDHSDIFKTALERLRAKIEYTNIAFGLLPKKFTLSELQNVYEIILGEELDKRNFRRKVKEVGLVQETNEKRREGASRPATLYVFAKKEPEVVEVL